MSARIYTTEECLQQLAVLLERPDVNLTLIDRLSAEELAENLTATSGFTNHPLIAQGAKHEYIWTKIDPAADPSILYESVLSVSRCVMPMSVHRSVHF